MWIYPTTICLRSIDHKKDDLSSRLTSQFDAAKSGKSIKLQKHNPGVSKLDIPILNDSMTVINIFIDTDMFGLPKADEQIQPDPNEEVFEDDEENGDRNYNTFTKIDENSEEHNSNSFIGVQ